MPVYLPLKRVATFTGIGGNFKMVWVATLHRNQWQPCTGIRSDYLPSETLWSAPLLCWKNETRINAYLDWREFNNLKTERLSRNEPLICTGYSNTKAADTTLFINGSRWRVDKPIWNPAAIMVRDEITNLSHTVSADVSEDGNYCVNQ